MKIDNNTLKRRAGILQILEKEGKVSVSHLSSLYGVSTVSIRNDLTLLEKKGLLIKTRGGAIKAQAVNSILSLHQKLKQNYPAKQRIGRKTVEFIQDGFSIVIDSGSTALEVAKSLKTFHNLTLITNSLPIADICADYKGIDIIIPGGNLRKDMLSLNGPLAVQAIQNFHCDVAIIGADSLSKDGIYTPLLSEAILSRKMMEVAQKVILATDSSKLQRKSLVKISGLDAIDLLITDKHISQTVLKELTSADLKVITC